MGTGFRRSPKKEREKMYVKKLFALYEYTIQNICEKGVAED